MRSVAFFFLIVVCVAEKNDGMLPALEEKLENKFTEYAGGVSKWLESFNDEHLGNTELGRFLHYNEIKTQLETTKDSGNQGRSMKKMGMTMMPLIFHIGATSTWMLITTVLTAKSLAVGLALLVFKIAVSSAKLAAFFTHLKAKQSDHHHDWASAWTPHYEHHDHHLEHHPDHHEH
ncbi:uncharacterized protein isoform X2 [Choristoneura fumiferana]|uniref:uncharacterized protein isoform X2 n=1 Tax=Choristoneura fumiferana TaxID=7141 RepID=UPI003D1566D7